MILLLAVVLDIMMSTALDGLNVSEESARDPDKEMV